ncbi:MAG: hypothetical protein NZ954_03550 [Thermofilaceae archaeon]|nr:hypothetical protein [Thermofilaceae archaeon]MCX8181130.1 hypothetical protein [Thermofilaceae archaeon]MDW8004864.1 hypothetical protein [Thermofilaceae archaeon]
MKAKLLLTAAMFVVLLGLAQPTVTVTPATLTPGGIVTISIGGGASGEKCGIEIRDPFNNVVLAREITLTPTGTGSTSWQIPSTAGFGTYLVYVSCETSGAPATPASFRVTSLVGGEAVKDLSPLLLTAVTLFVLTAAAIVAVRKQKK